MGCVSVINGTTTARSVVAETGSARGRAAVGTVGNKATVENNRRYAKFAALRPTAGAYGRCSRQYGVSASVV